MQGIIYGEISGEEIKIRTCHGMSMAKGTCHGKRDMPWHVPMKIMVLF